VEADIIFMARCLSFRVIVLNVKWENLKREIIVRFIVPIVLLEPLLLSRNGQVVHCVRLARLHLGKAIVTAQVVNLEQLCREPAMLSALHAQMVHTRTALLKHRVFSVNRASMP